MSYSLNLDTSVVTFVASMDGLTINEAAATTGWSARMLRYVERTGLIAPARTASGYRLYGPAELQRLRTLKELLARFDVGLSDFAFAARMTADAELRGAVQAWLEAQPRRPEHVEASDWLRFEQDKHERLLAMA
jgi:MerR family transcriptional regulator, copper efflux regulator